MNDFRAHHSILQDHGGYLWAPVLTDKDSDPEFAPALFHFHAIGKVDPDGGELKETISLYDMLERSERLVVARKSQGLANGNILVTETDRGRAFEVTRRGRNAWSFVNRLDEERVGRLMKAERYSSTYHVDGARCDG